jgi:hypothetical protein
MTAWETLQRAMAPHCSLGVSGCRVLTRDDSGEGMRLRAEDYATYMGFWCVMSLTHRLTWGVVSFSMYRQVRAQSQLTSGILSDLRSGEQ